MKFLPVVAEGVAVRQAALVSDESALEACLRWCAIQIDDFYLYLCGWTFTVLAMNELNTNCALMFTLHFFCLLHIVGCLMSSVEVRKITKCLLPVGPSACMCPCQCSLTTGWSKKLHKVNDTIILLKTTWLYDVWLQNYGVINFVQFFLDHPVLYMWGGALSVCQSVGRSVCLSVCLSQDLRLLIYWHKFWSVAGTWSHWSIKK